jgi:CrcB protein
MEYPSVILMVVGISSMSIAGVAGRIALLDAAQDGGFFTNSSQISVNLVGSLLIGFLYGVPDLCAVHMPLVYQALAAGFCGSLTTFSSWIYAIMKPGSDWSVELVTGLTVPFIAVLNGRDFATNIFSPTGSVENKEILKKLDQLLVVFFGVAAVAVMVAIGTTKSVSQNDLIACALGPIGALTRYVVSTSLNGRGLKNFMIGTFVANQVAVVIVGALSLCRDTNEWCNDSIVGIAGSLSTVSSWALDTVKIYQSNKGWAYLYSLTSVGVALAIIAPFLR